MTVPSSQIRRPIQQLSLDHKHRVTIMYKIAQLKHTKESLHRAQTVVSGMLMGNERLFFFTYRKNIERNR